MLGGQPVGGREDGDAGVGGEEAAGAVVGVEVADHPAAAVEVDEHRPRRRRGAVGDVEAAGRAPVGAGSSNSTSSAIGIGGPTWRAADWRPLARACSAGRPPVSEFSPTRSAILHDDVDVGRQHLPVDCGGGPNSRRCTRGGSPQSAAQDPGLDDGGRLGGAPRRRQTTRCRDRCSHVTWPAGRSCSGG